ncbi:MAG: histidine phosphatase family protein [Cyclobacteriaceae bacterium]|nr:histidine phosphatase family protein [Cyclobacteriaceae bacterium]
MTRVLHLLRHAQSAERQHSQHDRDRDLTTLGMKEAAIIGHHLKKNDSNIDLVVTSVAKRAQDTASQIHGILNLNYDVKVVEDLYEASVRTLLSITNQLDDEYKQVLLVGHNPYLSYFAEYLSRSEVGSMATCGLATLRFDINSWREVSEGTATLDNYIYPSMLE